MSSRKIPMLSWPVRDEEKETKDVQECEYVQQEQYTVVCSESFLQFLMLFLPEYSVGCNVSDSFQIYGIVVDVLGLQFCGV